MRRLPTAVRGVPLTLVGFAVLTLPVLRAPLVADERLAEALVGIGFVLIVLFFLLRGSRIAWSFFALTEAFAVGVQPFDPSPWWIWVLNVAGLATLMAPPSLRFVWRRGA